MFLPIRIICSYFLLYLTLSINSALAGDLDLGLALGVGERTNPLINSDDINIYWLLDIAYYGDKWFFDNGDLGINLNDSESYAINAILSVNSDRVYFSHLNDGLLSLDGSTGAGMSEGESGATEKIKVPDRDYALEAGVELYVNRDWGFIQAQWNVDISNTHNGTELWLNYGYDLIINRWIVTPSLGLSWRDSNLNNYYHGVKQSESSAALPAYEAGAGLNAYTQLSASYFISRRWRWASVVGYEKINSEAADSPIMEDDKVITVFTGIFYVFM